MELEKKVEGKQELEEEMKEMKAAMEAMEEKSSDENVEAENKSEDLKEKEEELKRLEELQEALIVNHRLSNDELQDARQQLISVTNLLFSFLPSFPPTVMMCHIN